ncbi:TonB-dependent siderophore receptor [Roseococcus pinisoli]|uniref:TonB-dependent siderophore receptor n=1 Tax=Roseococcus pinisoli TaxID=2835040 RepID=A0ABS5Q6V8_9PROT|nr:TonB-dependent siderophore receptor [Roseococcus pinisoli]MBS7809316.1 TonB-dependent siderophore receptor [Roseococcus pinisoli]
MSRHSRRAVRLLAVITPLALALPAGAQTPGSVELPQLDVQGQGAGLRPSPQAPDVQGYVAVNDDTATRTGTSLLETPQSLHVVSREEMDQQNPQTVRSLLRFLPGVNFSNDANNRLDGFQARGFAPDQYLDGLRLMGGTWAVPKVEPFMLDRAQLLLGPASVLYGQGSPGGLLNMESRIAGPGISNQIQLQGGSNNFGRASFDFNRPLNEKGTLFGRVTGTAYTNDTQVDHQHERRIAIAPSVTWRPDADTSLTFLGSYLYDPNAGFWNQLPLQGTLLPNRYGPIPRSFFVGDNQYEHFTREQVMLGYQFAHRFNDVWSVRQNLRYTQINTDYQEVQGSVLGADQRTLARNAYSSRENLNTLAIDNRAEARFTTGPLSHTLLLGLDYQHSHWRNFTRYGNAPSLDILNPVPSQAALGAYLPPPLFQNARQVRNQLGVYAQDQIRWGGWTLLLAGRQDWYESRTLNRMTGVTTDESARHFSGHIGLNYVFQNGIAPYVSYATSFQPVSGTSRTGSSFTPTTGEQVEVGIRYRPAGFNALFTLAAFDLHQNNVLTPDPADVRFSVQTGQVRSRGVEFSVVASPLPGLNLRGAVTHLDTEVTRSNTPGTVGRRPTNTPQDIVAAWAAYTIQGGMLRGLTIGGGVRYVGSAYATATNSQTIPSYTTGDALVSYDLGAVSERMAGATIAVNGYNITDKRYASTCGALGCYLGLGRTVLATLDYRF